MAPLPIRIFGDPVLRERAAEVTDFDDTLRRLAADMMETMREAQGLGLAANQVGILKRLFTCDVRGEDDDEALSGAFVNPEILERSAEAQEGEEGCLSFPGLFYSTVRPLRVRLRARDLSGQVVETSGQGLLARVLLHEVDHLDGILFIDHLARHDRKEAMRRIRAGELERPPVRRRDDPAPVA
ncbi:MAG TPA: peptide deformylase [Egibacteraceae bacterium]|nr:peptide deformylase [Egibacteraceae bacterium]